MDDAPVNLTILASHLMAWGIENVRAADAADALRVARAAESDRKPFDLVLSDLQMPDRDGIDLADALKAELAQPPPVVILSSVGRGPVPGRDTRNVARFVGKPFRRSQLFDAIATAIGQAPVRAGSPGRTSPSVPAAKASGRILVADDNAVNQRLASLLLEKAGYRVDAVADGAEAVEAVFRGRYDAVLMDCEMPVMDGYVAAAEIRHREAGASRVPIIAVTASARKEDVKRALAAGMDAHVTKPLDREHLYQVLAGLLGEGRPPAAAPGPAAIDTLSSLDPVAVEALVAIDGSGTLLRQMAGIFLRDAPSNFDALAAAAEAGDAARVAAAPHEMRGSVANFGAAGLVELLNKIELRARSGQPPSKRAVAAARAALGRVSADLRRLAETQSRDDAGGAAGDGQEAVAGSRRRDRSGPAEDV